MTAFAPTFAKTFTITVDDPYGRPWDGHSPRSAALGRCASEAEFINAPIIEIGGRAPISKASIRLIEDAALSGEHGTYSYFEVTARPEVMPVMDVVVEEAHDEEGGVYHIYRPVGVDGQIIEGVTWSNYSLAEEIQALYFFVHRYNAWLLGQARIDMLEELRLTEAFKRA